MNKQRKVLITITYNEMGIIIDTKAEELDSSAKPDVPDTNVGDMISRQAAKLKVARVIWEDGDSCYDFHDKCVDCLDNVPSAQPEPKWIPCSETEDIPDHEVLACDKYGEMMFGYLSYEDEQWMCKSYGDVMYAPGDEQWMCESDGDVMYDPIAWCEKPEPYREEGEE